MIYTTLDPLISPQANQSDFVKNFDPQGWPLFKAQILGVIEKKST